ncbi:unnamed protein product [Camellia sinensis]
MLLSDPIYKIQFPSFQTLVQSPRPSRLFPQASRLELSQLRSFISSIPNLIHVDLVHGCVVSPENSGILLTRNLVSLHIDSNVFPNGFVLENYMLSIDEVDSGLKSLAGGYPNLRKLMVINASEIGLLSVVEECPTLQELELHRCNDQASTPNACDSEDNDYDSDGSEVDKKVEGDESSSDESDFYYSSEDNGDSPKNKQKLELPSFDDLEDDDYDHDATDLSDQVKQESSNKLVPDELMYARSDQNKPCGVSNGERSKVGRRKKQSLNDELSYLLESGPGQRESAPLSGKRHVERLDYKRLHDVCTKTECFHACAAGYGYKIGF